MAYKIYTTEEFNKDFNKLSSQERIRANKILKQLKEKGDEVGKPLSGLAFFREKKFNGNRLYYLVYDELFIILAIAISDKKAQQATINRILLDLVEYHQYVHKLSRKET